MKFINQQKASFSIEITPLIDIVFLLVIFFGVILDGTNCITKYQKMDSSIS